ncbi:AAA family ATPase [Terrilactibacillus sp. BCM23-1]|uniref:Replication-associated recombination protein A n=1 Tax=Terrilactibacillus tamarindi TaxID=2599694 RepID=A0A6N8CS22_9BACI|nr:AAA family ATPase [Terrilactibacillus tamarindi]MTT32448.1 AAA family ATPase [Terrilactibacillus tamarindi]
MDLFDFSDRSKTNRGPRPLASRMRPRSLDEFIGQEHIIGHGRLLRRAIQADKLTPMIFFGPPGTGKTTLAQIIAASTKAYFTKLNAVTSGVNDIRKIINEAKDRLKYDEQRTILFIDEIHRFNKSQQDALLPSVEEGTIILIGATTESPMFEINAALLSRSRLFRFLPLSHDDIKQILKNTLEDKERGYGHYHIKVDEDAMEHIVQVASGDSRTALHALELAVLTTPPDSDGTIHINKEVAEESIQEKMLQYDKNGDNHYDTVSAFIKSMRGSDPDATLYWLAKMIVAGEDPNFIARRIYVHAAEDVGLADPNALLIAQAAAYAVQYVGFPEARIPLSEAALYIATAPKSNSVITGIDQAIQTVKNEKNGEVPRHLRDAHYKGAKKLGHGIDYQYPHNFKDGYVPQDYLPRHLKNRSFYKPVNRGYEKSIQKRLDYFTQRKNEKK